MAIELSPERNAMIRNSRDQDGLPIHAILSAEEWASIKKRLGLSKRELEISQLIVDGCTESQSAEELGISVHTVHTHVKHIYGKASVRDQRQLVVKLFTTFMEL